MNLWVVMAHWNLVSRGPAFPERLGSIEIAHLETSLGKYCFEACVPIPGGVGVPVTLVFNLWFIGG